MIDRKKLVRKHNPEYYGYNPYAPLTIGNGNFCFTADITGLQTFYQKQKDVNVPLCTMTQWGWHTKPAGKNRDCYYTHEDLKRTYYDNEGRMVYYASEKQPGNEEVYDWLRENPHRMNLARIGLKKDYKDIEETEIKDPKQKLDLYSGLLSSSYKIDEKKVEVETVCAQTSDVLGIKLDSEIRDIQVCIELPYGASDITGSDWEHPEWYETEVIQQTENSILLKERLDKTEYFVFLRLEQGEYKLNQESHKIYIIAKEEKIQFVIGFLQEQNTEDRWKSIDFSFIKNNSEVVWKKFWNKTGIIDFSKCRDERAKELERREILSLYLLKIQSCGDIPPQETGLTCNSWYGKFHLEMYMWHCAWAPLYSNSDLISRSIQWYADHVDEAKKNAEINGYKGARWPKMVDFRGVDSPSPIATLLIWQQPHILYMLRLILDDIIKQERREFLKKYWNIIEETANFMCDFVSFNKSTERYDLPAPLIPAQEEHDPRTTKNPVFELEYWRFGLELAVKWAEELGIQMDRWSYIAERMAESSMSDGKYLACESCPDTFENYNRDHPSMLGALGILPGERIDQEAMLRTFHAVLEKWDFSTMWGWDFAMMAMTATRLGVPELAIDILMKDSPKNYYAENGNNFQKLRTDLPLYLPGNGSLLWALGMMAAGYGNETMTPGFPDNGKWEIQYENIHSMPY